MGHYIRGRVTVEKEGRDGEGGKGTAGVTGGVRIGIGIANLRCDTAEDRHLTYCGVLCSALPAAEEVARGFLGAR